MKYLAFIILLIGAQALASEGGGHHGEEGIPKEVMYQAINLTLFLGILVYFLNWNAGYLQKDNCPLWPRGRRSNPTSL